MFNKSIGCLVKFKFLLNNRVWGWGACFLFCFVLFSRFFSISIAHAIFETYLFVYLKFNLLRCPLFSPGNLILGVLQPAFQSVEEKEAGKGSFLGVIQNNPELRSYSRSCV